MLKIKNLSKDYGKIHALKNLSLEIPTGMFGLLGPNGAGKTTLMRILATIIPYTSGEITMEEVNWEQPQLVRNMIGYLPQKFSMYSNIRVNEVLKHIAILKGIYRNNEELVQTALEKVNLLDYQDKKIGSLSGGMIRRVGIAQAILGDPPLIIVDEPTAGLDPEERIRFRRLLHQLSKKATVIISTHIVEDIEATCEHVAILHRGQLLAEGEINTISEIAKGKTWSITVSLEDYFQLSEKWNIISSQCIGNEYILNIISDTRPDGALPAKSSLEDGYLFLMKGVSDEEL